MKSIFSWVKRFLQPLINYFPIVTNTLEDFIKKTSACAKISISAELVIPMMNQSSNNIDFFPNFSPLGYVTGYIALSAIRPDGRRINYSEFVFSEKLDTDKEHNFPTYYADLLRKAETMALTLRKQLQKEIEVQDHAGEHAVDHLSVA